MSNTVMALVVPEDEETPMMVRMIDPHLKALSEIVGGYIEIIHPRNLAFGPWHGYCDEEGKLKGKAVNIRANYLAAQIGWIGAGSDLLVGSVVFLADGDDGEEADVPTPVVEAAREMAEVEEVTEDE